VGSTSSGGMAQRVPSMSSGPRSTWPGPWPKADPRLATRFPSCPAAAKRSCRSLITYVTDRPGHDHRYAINAGKLADELSKRCSVDFHSGLDQTIRWYLAQEDWWRDVTSGAYKAWIDKNYGFRIAV